ncbi:MAG: hypothetical protein LBH43_05285 [Treponema sp.]|nr:hypothetical protein [Treponema sp.]
MGTVVCNYDGSSIKVSSNFLGSKVQLFIDNKLMDKYTTFVNPIEKTLILKAVDYPFKSGAKTIEVYNKALLFNRFMVCINNEYIGGYMM